jgi:hypothetical protein
MRLSTARAGSSRPLAPGRSRRAVAPQAFREVERVSPPRARPSRPPPGLQDSELERRRQAEMQASAVTRPRRGGARDLEPRPRDATPAPGAWRDALQRVLTPQCSWLQAACGCGERVTARCWCRHRRWTQRRAPSLWRTASATRPPSWEAGGHSLRCAADTSSPRSLLLRRCLRDMTPSPLCLLLRRPLLTSLVKTGPLRAINLSTCRTRAWWWRRWRRWAPRPCWRPRCSTRSSACRCCRACCRQASRPVPAQPQQL